MSRVQKDCTVEVVVAASPEEVWEVVADVTRVGEWSHECRTARWLSGAAAARPGARFRGTNRVGPLRWSRTSEILVADPPHELEWRTMPTAMFPDSTRWRVRIRPVRGGTSITQSFLVVRAPALLDRVYARLIPAHQDRTAGLDADLVRLAAVARGGPRP